MDLAGIENHVIDWKLASKGGTKIRIKPMPKRMAMGSSEIAMVSEAIATYQREGIDPGQYLRAGRWQ